MMAQEFLTTPEFWLMLCFVVLVLCIYKPVKKFVLSYIDREILRIRSNIDSANASKLALDSNMQELRKQLEQIKKERADVVGKAKLHAEHIARDSAKELELLIQHKEQDALNQLEYLKTTAIQDIRTSLVENANNLVTTYLTKHTQELGRDVSIASRLIKSKIPS